MITTCVKKEKLGHCIANLWFLSYFHNHLLLSRGPHCQEQYPFPTLYSCARNTLVSELRKNEKFETRIECEWGFLLLRKVISFSNIYSLFNNSLLLNQSIRLQVMNNKGWRTCTNKKLIKVHCSSTKPFLS